MFNQPRAYFITFRTYGSWLHGDSRGWVDRRHNHFGTPLQPANRFLEAWEASELKTGALERSDAQRSVVDATIRAVCEHRQWTLLELNVRTNHVHVVVSAGGPPEQVMTAFKAWATRRLTEAGLVRRGERVWSRHGSTIYLFRPEKVDEKRRYVRDGQ